jgi:hypothetical protein
MPILIKVAVLIHFARRTTYHWVKYCLLYFSYQSLHRFLPTFLFRVPDLEIQLMVDVTVQQGTEALQTPYPTSGISGVSVSSVL